MVDGVKGAKSFCGSLKLNENNPKGEDESDDLNISLDSIELLPTTEEPKPKRSRRSQPPGNLEALCSSQNDLMGQIASTLNGILSALSEQNSIFERLTNLLEDYFSKS
ncbi:uncharacterized protein LOC142225911 [Haematobia irritans]|uniref:uncharacterized protein LOC142225911 n=1 Tax=Haematobia irritans TaxID=7368 RepID=UPI003F4F9FCD